MEEQINITLYIEAYAYNYLCRWQGEKPLQFWGDETYDVEACKKVVRVHAVTVGTIGELSLRGWCRLDNILVEKRERLSFRYREKENIQCVSKVQLFYEDNILMKEILLQDEATKKQPEITACEATCVKKAYLTPRVVRREEIIKCTLDLFVAVVTLLVITVVIDTLNTPEKLAGFLEHILNLQKVLKLW